MVNIALFGPPGAGIAPDLNAAGIAGKRHAPDAAPGILKLGGF